MYDIVLWYRKGGSES